MRFREGLQQCGEKLERPDGAKAVDGFIRAVTTCDKRMESLLHNLPNIPLLLIDDEADNASINVKDKKDTDGDADSVSAINGKIREILSTFERSAYVGYTATPFANIFVNPSCL